MVFKLGSQEPPGGCWGVVGREPRRRQDRGRKISLPASIRPITQVPPESLGILRGGPTRDTVG